ncbi:universal stress protein [Microbacterium telephonicum]|uniref:Nucleotide-binding universal stress UspA family protein n=1 Tax=Microbacterium telephonicum TaxID=1714841 RepID=A0A498BX31_9MICO|nr:universal stress protein [Microbacterium telephonicum]RLK47995.1 nucleotide-binding universal stress UspA family protein [Microbacterium telephonicum]
MSTNIIVGVTAAPAAARALEWAVARAAERRHDLTLISVVGGAIGAVGEGDVLVQAMDAAAANLATAAERIAEAHPTLTVTTRVEAGNPVAVLLEASESADLLVIGSDYRGQGQGPARGAHGIRLAAGAHCPVVVVPDIDPKGRRGVVVGVDGGQVSEHALRFAAAEADRLGEPLTVVSVWTPLAAPRNDLAVYPELYLTNMQATTEEIQALALAGIASDHPDLEVIRRVEQGFPSQVIDEAAQTARMAVVGTHGRGAIARFLLGSVSHEVLSRLSTVTAVVR